MMKEDVLKFINTFTESSCDNGYVRYLKRDVVELFDNKCSYWFAYILFRRFIMQNAEIMCDINHKHFGTKINGRVYDIRGDVTVQHSWTKWNDMDSDMKEKLSKEYIMF